MDILCYKFGPWRLRREARTQSIELQRYVFIHVHEMSQPNKGFLGGLYLMRQGYDMNHPPTNADFQLSNHKRGTA